VKGKLGKRESKNCHPAKLGILREESWRIRWGESGLANNRRTGTTQGGGRDEARGAATQLAVAPLRKDWLRKSCRKSRKEQRVCNNQGVSFAHTCTRFASAPLEQGAGRKRERQKKTSKKDLALRKKKSARRQEAVGGDLFDSTSPGQYYG